MPVEVPREWFLVEDRFRAELRRFALRDEVRRLLDVLVSYTLHRGRLASEFSRSDLMALARLDKFQLSKGLAWLRAAGMVRVTENFPRKDRARLQRQDCPTIEILLESSSWFKADRGSSDDRKRLEETEQEEARLIHKGLCESNPVQVDLPPMGLLEAYVLAEQECARDRLADEARAGDAGDCKLAGSVRATGEMAAAAQNGRGPSAPSRPEPREDSSCFKNNRTPKTGGEAVVYKTTAPEGQRLSIKQLPAKAPPTVAVREAVVFTTTGDGALPLKSSPRSSGTELTLKNSPKRAALPTPARGFRLKEEFETEFLERLKALCVLSRDTETIAKNENWWRLAFLASPGAAMAALDELELRVKDSSLSERVENCGAWMKTPYYLAGGAWISQAKSTPEQRAYFGALGWTKAHEWAWKGREFAVHQSKMKVRNL